MNTRLKTVDDLWQGELFLSRQSKDQILEGDALSNRIRALFEEYKEIAPSFTNSISTVIQGENIVTGYLEFSSLTKRESSFAVPSEARKYIPFPPEDTIFSSVRIPPLNLEPNRMAYFFVGIKRQKLEGLQALFRACNLSVKQVEIPVAPLIRQFMTNHEVPENEFIALIHLGFGSTIVVIERGGFPYFYKEFPIGGRDFTQEFVRSKRLEWNEAEKFQRKYNISQHHPQIDALLGRMVNEIRTVIGSFSGLTTRATLTISRAYLSGGFSLMTGLPQYLAFVFPFRVRLESWDNLKDDNIAEYGLSPASYSLAVGLAMRSN